MDWLGLSRAQLHRAVALGGILDRTKRGEPPLSAAGGCHVFAFAVCAALVRVDKELIAALFQKIGPCHTKKLRG